MTESDSAAVRPSVPTEKTFLAYSPEQGVHYAKARRGYHQSLYKTILDHHTSTGGKVDILLDVGCGPGTVAREIGGQFAQVIGLDPAEGMIAAARSLGGASSTSEPIRFNVSTAEELGSNLSPPVADGSVDLITAATAAHWFNMPGFWAAAGRVLKPGGTVAIWTTSAMHIHPSVPNHERLQTLVQTFRSEYMEPYTTPGNLLTENLYETLPLPWNLREPVLEFDESTFFRKEWNKDGLVADHEEFFLGQQTWDMDTVEKIMATMSTVTRWREAHPDAAGTERDVVKILRREIETLLHEAGVEKGKEMVTSGVSGVLLMAKKKKEA
ncbi:methyltransferase domain-containing protein [Colletotrichum truncatum]|uniref:Methyltransferase domain-containing protein n=1 Tax=Colletotrichum truncatum TaxID=5467 RepID=A0ACC3YTJ1_COLTU|nr:methyltransferase domain-containing protein [Colletotrichum truncatum]KAF6798372.1 methyltransferase domain-containing protein [Colletotrichum truncatum]